MPKIQHMVRLDDEIYTKIVLKRAELIAKYKAHYTVSETIEVILLEANAYENGSK